MLGTFAVPSDIVDGNILRYVIVITSVHLHDSRIVLKNSIRAPFRWQRPPKQPQTPYTVTPPHLTTNPAPSKENYPFTSLRALSNQNSDRIPQCPTNYPPHPEK